MAGPGTGLYDQLYRRFFEKRQAHQGYDFQAPSAPNVPPTKPTFRERLSWWTARAGRRKQLLAARDCAQRAIVELKGPKSTEPGASMVAAEPVSAERCDTLLSRS